MSTNQQKYKQNKQSTTATQQQILIWKSLPFHHMMKLSLIKI